MELDHLAVVAPTLNEASTAIETALGVALQPGGRHATFGTHNQLLGLGNGLYLEAIAIDPDAPDPGRARWFDLDRFSGPARLANWVCRTGDLDACLARLPQGRASEMGEITDLQRGDLSWRMAVPVNGRLPCDNMFPALIQWHGTLHPAAMLAATGCFLHRLVVAHPDAGQLRDELSPGDPRVVFEPGKPGLMAEFDTANGRRVLR